MTVRNTVLVAIAVLLLGTLATAQVPTYSVGPQDVLTITVWDHPDLSGKFSVEADSTFTFPLIGRIKAGGMTLREVESELRRALQQDGYLKNPQVSVAVDEYRSQRIFVVGEVRTPGTYPLSAEMTLEEALARAGSTTEKAGDEAIIVHHSSSGASTGPLLPDEDGHGAAEVRHVDLKELHTGVLSQDVLVHDGDTILVPRAGNIYVTGNVRNPGGYAIQRDMTVLQALSLAGGVTERGAGSRVRVVRTIGGQKRELRVKLDDLVKEGDTIVVPERLF